jgi:type II secretion system protein H
MIAKGPGIRQQGTESKHRRARLLPAFTLAEMLVVIVLLGVVALMIVPRMSGSIAREESRESAASFAHTASMVRELAVSRRQLFSIEIDGRGYGVQMKSGKDGSYSPVQVSWLRPRQWGEHVRLEGIMTPDGQVITTGTHKLEFRPDGSSSGAMLRLASGDVKTGVSVDSVGGRVTFGDRDELAKADQQYDLGD